MKPSRPLVAGSVLILVALFLVIASRSGREPADTDAERGTVGLSQGDAGNSDAAPADRRYSRNERSKQPAESPDARTLKLLWARGRGQELLVALDQLSARADADDWRQVAAVLEEKAASDGRHEIATYLLATGHGAPAGIRLAIYAAALDNPDEGIRDSARLELLNLTGQEFTSRAEASAWIEANPEVSRDEDEEESEE